MQGYKDARIQAELREFASFTQLLRSVIHIKTNIKHVSSGGLISGLVRRYRMAHKLLFVIDIIEKEDLDPTIYFVENLGFALWDKGFSRKFLNKYFATFERTAKERTKDMDKVEFLADKYRLDAERLSKALFWDSRRLSVSTNTAKKRMEIAAAILGGEDFE